MRSARKYFRHYPLVSAYLILIGLTCMTMAGFFAFPPAHAETAKGIEQNTMNLNFVGDILLASGVGDLIKSQGPLAPWEGVKDILSSADFTIGNLECAAGTTGKPVAQKAYTFRAVPEALEGLRQSGFDVVSLANNHTLDFGVECMLETIGNVKKYGIIPIGAGATEKDAREYAILEKNGIKVGILATGSIIPEVGWAAKGPKPGLAVDYSGWHPQIEASIKELRQKVDFIVVYIHWGEERKTAPEDWVLRLDESLRDAGADIIIGTHPHVQRGFAFSGQKLTAYSLGNFVFTTRPDFPLCQIGAILRVTLSKRTIEKVEILPTKIIWGKTIALEGKERAEALLYLSALTQPLGADVSESGQVVEMPFVDMKHHWARFAAAFLARHGIVTGYDNSLFLPEQNVTRGELAKLLALTFFEDQVLPEPSSKSQDPFPIPKEHWAYPYLSFLASKGIIKDAEEVREPNAPAKRKEVCLWLHRSMTAGTSNSETAGVLEKDAPGNVSRPFPDLEELAPSERKAIDWCSERGIIRGFDDGTFRPEGNLTRAQITMMLWRLLQKS